MEKISRGGGLPPDPLEERHWRKLAAEARRVFAVNEVDRDGLYYHMPSHVHYPSLFAWDSGFHAAAMCRLDPGLAARELETLFRWVAEDGHLPHEVLLANRASRHWRRRLVNRFVGWEFDSRGASYMVDPPSYHYAAELVFRRTRDRSWLERNWPAMCRCLDYLLEERDARGEGLVVIFHPWESGTDLSPQFFRAMGIEGQGLRNAVRSVAYPILLFAHNRLKGWDPAALSQADLFVCQELTMNCLTLRACRSMAYLAGELGREKEREKYLRRARLLMRSLDELCWDEREGCYFPRFGYRRPRLARRRTADSLMPIFGGFCREERARRLVEEHLLNPREFWTEYLVPFNPLDEAEGTPRWAEKRLWSGHCIWVNFCWMLSIGLDEHGFREEAREITRRVVHMILREGFYEYYDSRSGAGRRIPDFCWPALALDMMARFWPDACGGSTGA
jgi:hypothetical protein